jgi:hypothetical protein
MHEGGQGMRTRTVVQICVLLLAAMVFVVAQSPDGNEANAVGTLKSINAAQTTFMRTYSDVGYACDLGSLGPDAKGGAASAKSANLLDKGLTSGKEYNGYVFKMECKQKTKPQSEYRVSAVPAKGAHGRVFCTDESAIVRFGADTKACFANGELAK